MKKCMFIVLISVIASLAFSSTELYFWHVFDGPLKIEFEKIISEYNSSQKEVEVQAVHMGNYGDLLKKLKGLTSGNMGYPDLFLGYSSWVSEFDVNKMGVAGEVIDSAVFASIHPTMAEDAAHKGVQYGLPFNKSVMMMYINRDLVSAAQEKQLETAEGVMDFVRDYYEKENKPALSSNLSVWFFENMLLNLGGTFDDLSGTAAGRALDFLRNGFKEKRILVKSGYKFQDLWTSGKVPVIFSSIVSLRFMEKKIDFNWTRKHFPAAGDNERYSVVSGSNLYISSDEDKRSAIKSFLSWFYTDEHIGSWCEATGYLPIAESHSGGSQLKGVDLIIEPAVETWFMTRKKLSNILKDSLISNDSSTKLLQRAN